jgi:hypothetical protein
MDTITLRSSLATRWNLCLLLAAGFFTQYLF